MVDWWIDEEAPYPGPEEHLIPLLGSNPRFETHINLHNPAHYPAVGEFFFNGNGQCLGLVLEVNDTEQTVTLQPQGMFR